MKDSNTVNAESGPLTLRDHLAIDRTTLANERTLLGYGRTALALAVVGASTVKIFSSPALIAAGWSFVAGSMAVLLIGLRRFWQMSRRIDERRA